MAFMIVISPPLPSRVNIGEEEEFFGPFVTRVEAEKWIAELASKGWPAKDARVNFFNREFEVRFLELDDYVAFGEEVN